MCVLEVAVLGRQSGVYLANLRNLLFFKDLCGPRGLLIAAIHEQMLGYCDRTYPGICLFAYICLNVC